MKMTSNRSYLVQALYSWILDNDCTPHILIDTALSDVDVPPHYVKNNQIVLNISPSAVVSFMMDQNAISFNARFGGVPTDIYVPMRAVMGIFARENGQGMMFDMAEEPDPPQNNSDADNNKTKSASTQPSRKPSLRVVK